MSELPLPLQLQLPTSAVITHNICLLLAITAGAGAAAAACVHSDYQSPQTAIDLLIEKQTGREEAIRSALLLTAAAVLRIAASELGVKVRPR